MNIQQTLYDRVIEWAMDVDPQDCRQEIAWRRRRFPQATPREVAAGMLTEYSLVSLAEGTLTALATGPILAVPAALVDAAFIMRAAARLNGCIGLLASPDYFDDDRWRADVTSIIGDKPVAEQTARRTAIGMANRTLVQVVSRRSVARFIPLVGGLIGGAWNWWELRRLGKRILAYHFDDTAVNAWPDAASDVSEDVSAAGQASGAVDASAAGAGKPAAAALPVAEVVRVEHVLPAEEKAEPVKRARAPRKPRAAAQG